MYRHHEKSFKTVVVRKIQNILWKSLGKKITLWFAGISTGNVPETVIVDKTFIRYFLKQRFIFLLKPDHLFLLALFVPIGIPTFFYKIIQLGTFSPRSSLDQQRFNTGCCYWHE